MKLNKCQAIASKRSETFKSKDAAEKRERARERFLVTSN